MHAFTISVCTHSQDFNVAIYVYTVRICYVPSPTLKIHTPGTPTLLVSLILRMLEVRDPGIVTWLMPSPALIPATAPPPEVHSISAYKNITNDSY